MTTCRMYIPRWLIETGRDGGVSAGHGDPICARVRSRPLNVTRLQAGIAQVVRRRERL